jgi:excisionase family DNA binding protein
MGPSAFRGVRTMRERRHKQSKVRSSRPGGRTKQSPVEADRAPSALAAALAEIAALRRAIGGNSQSTPGLPDRLAYTVNDTIRVLSLSRATINKLIKSNELKSVRILRRRLITRAAIEDLLKRSEQ